MLCTYIIPVGGERAIYKIDGATFVRKEIEMTPFFETKLGKLYCGDCLEIMASLDWQSVDMVLADLPYGIVDAEWDQPLPFPKLWWLYERLVKPDGAILLFGMEPFSSKCRLSNPTNYRFDWKWDKVKPSGNQLAKFRPLQRIEDVMVFGVDGKRPAYHPKKLSLAKPVVERCNLGANRNLRGFSNPIKQVVRTDRYPHNLLVYQKPSPKRSQHQTQKSLELCRYLIDSHSLPGQVVLDNTAGSGSSLLAAEQLGRKWIGIELLKKHCQVIRNRFNDASSANTNPPGVYTSHWGNNADLMAKVASLYFRPGFRIADVTYGKGVFWRNIDKAQYDFHPSDLKTCPNAAFDFRRLPYQYGSFDVVVLDPPYIHNPSKRFYEQNYRNAETTKGLSHSGIMQLYQKGMEEGARILKSGGLLIVKCQDEIESGQQRWSHIEIMEIACKLGMVGQDLFVLARHCNPYCQKTGQKHARKNHSYLWVFKKV